MTFNSTNLNLFSSNKFLNEITSFQLDLLRLSAALAVFLVYAKKMWFPIKSIYINEYLAHAAVLISFVLLGYVIYYTTSVKNRGRINYAQAHLSRLYSVLISGLFIMALVEYLTSIIDPTLLEEYTRGLSLLGYILTLCFLNEIWFFSSAPPLNGPLWSLSYESWYYAIFDLLLYKGSSLKSYVLPIIACIIAGTKILVMFPIWILGVVAYKNPSPKLNPILIKIFVFVITLVSYLSLLYLKSYPFTLGVYPFFFSSQFITDYALDFLIVVVIWLMKGFKRLTSIFLSYKGKSVFRRIADLTFPIYVLHFPLLVMYRTIFGLELKNRMQFMYAVLSVLILSSFIGLEFN